MGKFVSKRDESVRLFKNPVLEFFSRAHPATPLFYLPILVYLAYVGVAEQGWLIALALFGGGIVVWSLTEYWVHRGLFHAEPRSPWLKRMHYLWHGVHHDYPRDSTRLVMPLLSSVPLAIIFYGLFRLITGSWHAPLFAGFAFGYISYDLTHYAIHHWPMRNRVFLWLKRHHLRHHFSDDHAGYGVTSPLWDFVFRTRYPVTKRREAEPSPVPTTAPAVTETPLAAPN
jgi:sterol desaturase/sphingolipid hydroxylase (fatty acid hydroxylase superfamily)